MADPSPPLRTESVRRVYLDYNATTPLHPAAREAMLPLLAQGFGNPSSAHWFGREARKVLELARRQIADLLGVKDQYDLVFTSGATESTNCALKGVVEALRDRGDHLVTTAVEHRAVLNVCRDLEGRGCRVTYVGTDGTGRVDPAAVEAAITPNTILISVMHANNETGSLQPVEEIGRMARARGIAFHVDAAQTVGKVPVNVESMNADLLSLSAHKFYGPKGVGALFVRKGTPLHPLIVGGSHERNRRAGTENAPGIVGMGAAAAACREEMSAEAPRLAGLRDRLHRGVLEQVKGVRLNGHQTERLPNTLNLSFEGVEWEGLILALDLEGLAVSTGSACMAGAVEPSHVLKAMGVPPHLTRGVVRLSLGRETTEDEIRYAIQVIPKVVERLRTAGVGTR